MNKLIARCGWWEAEFSLDADMDELEIGQPVSLAVQTLGVGSGIPFITELGVVPHGAVKGAVVRNRRPVPTAKLELPKPTAASPPPSSPQQHPRSSTATRRPNARPQRRDEVNRRIDWVEAHTGRVADVEAIVIGMKRELNGPSLDDLARDRLVHPLHDGIIRRPIGQVLGVR